VSNDGIDLPDRLRRAEIAGGEMAYIDRLYEPTLFMMWVL
jgi:hypothetical protein